MPNPLDPNHSLPYSCLFHRVADTDRQWGERSFIVAQSCRVRTANHKCHV
jgi:hypothetical protein